ncbi:MAG: insulinase family protein [candidate division WOR-3 bacterium]|nr:insulinase family protein [candidate division WOR-3 bacterium]
MRSNIQVTKINPYFSIITEEMDYLASAAFGIFFAHGSRYETEENQGICHLIEHMLFKGTKSKTAQEIAETAESAGAILDGFTSKEFCGIYCRFLSDNFDKILDLLGEIISSPRFDESDLEKEKNVIEQEITEALEDPREHVFTLLYEALFPNHPLSFPIAGTKESVRAITKKQLTDYWYHHLLPSKVCISAAGKIEHKRLIDRIMTNTHLSFHNKKQDCLKASTDIERVYILQERKELTQIHVAAAGVTFSYHDERRYALSVLDNILGGSMSSRYFQRLREKEGLVYTISSFYNLYSDIGLFGVYYITDFKNYSKVLKAGIEEVLKLKQFGITKDELQRAVNFCKGMLALELENPMSRMMRNARSCLLLDKIIPIEEALSAYDRLTVEDINNATNILDPTAYSIALIGQQVEDLANVEGRIGKPIKVIVRD